MHTPIFFFVGSSQPTYVLDPPRKKHKGKKKLPSKIIN